jgi:RNA polymerase sigma-70 factor (ECF subfamily)
VTQHFRGLWDVVIVRDDPPVVSFDDWYRHQWPRLVAWVTFSIGDQAQAEDIAADSFARALARWDKLTTQGEPTAWVYTVALNAVRKRWHRRTAEHEALGRYEARTNPVGQEQQVPQPEIWTAVRRLPDRARTAIALRYVADLTEREIADVMGISRGTVASTLSDARTRLATELRPPHIVEDSDCGANT